MVIALPVIGPSSIIAVATCTSSGKLSGTVHVFSERSECAARQQAPGMPPDEHQTSRVLE